MDQIPGVGMILGTPWLEDNHVTTQHRSNEAPTTTFEYEGKQVTLPPSEGREPRATISEVKLASYNSWYLSHKNDYQFRKSSVYVRIALTTEEAKYDSNHKSDTEYTDETAASEKEETVDAACTQKDLSSVFRDTTNVLNQTHGDPRLAELVREFSDVFPEEVPDGLPPKRDVEFDIELEPGAQPVHKPTYRLSPAEMEEVNAQVTYTCHRLTCHPQIKRIARHCN